MTREESIALYERAQAAEKAKEGEGAKVWNAWAEDMLRQQAETRSGHQRNDYLPQSAAETDEWHRDASADLSRYIFDAAILAKYIFPGPVNFSQSCFFHETSFHGVEFMDEAAFTGATFVGKADLSETTFHSQCYFADVEFRDFTLFIRTQFHGKPYFHKATFTRALTASNATFFAEADFFRSSFLDDADFDEAEFHGEALFGKATFMGRARFDKVKFNDMVLFVMSDFSGIADFQGATFNNTSIFGECSFRQMADFRSAQFNGIIRFEAISCDRLFLVSGARFAIPPSFNQAKFSEPPRLDYAHIAKSHRGANAIASYRTLRRLAVMAIDHAGEANFLAGEIISSRHVHHLALPRPWHLICAWDSSPGERSTLVWRWNNTAFDEWPGIWPGGTRYWAGEAYQTFSDFGRSMVLPIAWWLYVFGLSAVAYLSQYFARTAKGGALTSLIEAIRWTGKWLFSCLSAGALPAPEKLYCVVGTNPMVNASHIEPWSAALYLSVRRALIFSTGDDNDKLSIAYACLYGDYSKEMGSTLRVVPHIPDAVSVLAITQSLLSAALIFLFLLAVRNHFRIK